MPKDSVVTPVHLLAAVSWIQRHPSPLEDLDEREPDLAAYLMEHLSMIHGQLDALGGPYAKTRKVYRAVQRLLLTCLQAQQLAFGDFWELPKEPQLLTVAVQDAPRQANLVVSCVTVLSLRHSVPNQGESQ